MDIEDFLEGWNEDDLAELLEMLRIRQLFFTEVNLPFFVNASIGRTQFKLTFKTLRKPAVLSGEEVVVPRK